MEWHGHLMVTLEVIMREFPGCASVCDELKTIDYELRQEVEGMIPEGLRKSQVITQASRMFLRNQCDRAAELLSTLSLSLK